MLTQSIALCCDESTDLLNRQALQTNIKAMIDTTAGRLQYALRQSGIKNAEIAEACEISAQAVSGWLKTGRISKNALFIVEEKTGFSAQWISTGLGPQRVSSDKGNLVEEESPIYFGPSIPVVGTAQLGPEGYWEETQHPVGYGDGSVLWVSTDSNAYALKCVGDSMAPRIRHGEFVIVEPNHSIIPGDEVLVRTTDGRSMIKVFLYERDGMIYLNSINDQYGNTCLSRDTVEKIHYVAGIAKAALHRNTN